MEKMQMFKIKRISKRAICVGTIIVVSTIANAQNTNSGYTRKDGKVFFLHEEIEHADVKTFKVLAHGYAIDKKNVYYKGDVLKYVEPSTFKLKERNDAGYYKTESEVFYGGKRMTDVFTARNFKDLGDGYAIDSFNAYYRGVKIQGAHVSGFKNLGNGYAKDVFNTYYQGKKTEEIK